MATFTVGSTQMKRVGARVEETSALYTDKTTTDNGEWIDMSGVEYCNYVVNGITTGTVVFNGWNGSTAPAATEHGEPALGIASSESTLVSSLTADGVICFPHYAIFRFMKCRISVATTITLDVDMKRVRLT